MCVCVCVCACFQMMKKAFILNKSDYFLTSSSLINNLIVNINYPVVKNLQSELTSGKIFDQNSANDYTSVNTHTYVYIDKFC